MRSESQKCIKSSLRGGGTGIPAIRILLISLALAGLFFGGVNLTAQNTVLFPGLTGQELLDSLTANFKPASVLNYNMARDTLFSRIYSRNDSLTGVYSGFTIFLNPNADPSSDALAKGINTEHTWPRSKGAASGNALSDMHHLYPAKDNVNSARSNYPFAEIVDTQTDFWYWQDWVLNFVPTHDIDEFSEVDFDARQFEPREIHKGNVARAMFYFYTMYKQEADDADPTFFDLQKNTLYQWHKADAVDSLEVLRTNRIAEYQQDKANPFIVDTTLVRRAYFAEGNGSSGVFLNCGGNSFRDSQGRVYQADRAFTPGGFGYIQGVAGTFSGEVSSTTDDSLYLSMHGRKDGPFRYRFDIPDGDYLITLFFTEPSFSSAGSRVFDVEVQNSVALANFDIFQASGGKLVAHAETVSATVGNGALTVDFYPITATYALISAIAVTPAGGPTQQAEDAEVSSRRFAGMPAGIELHPNFPNPFNPRTEIRFELSVAMNLKLQIFNVVGQKIRDLDSGFHPAGAFQLTWDGTDDRGRAVPSGLYFYRLEGQGLHLSRKMILLR